MKFRHILKVSTMSWVLVSCSSSYMTGINSFGAPNQAYSGAAFSPQPNFTYAGNANKPHTFTDKLEISAFSDGACMSPAPGSLSASANPMVISSALAGNFSGMAYTDANHLEETIYLKALSLDSGSAICSPAITMSQYFNAPLGYVVSGTTGAAGATGASENDSIVSFKIDSVGRYIGVGTSVNGTGGTQLALWRYNPDGTLDTTMGSSGVVTYGVTGAAGATGASESDLPVQLNIDTSGNYVVVGSSLNSSGGRELAIWRYTSSGILDTTFAGTGVVIFGVTGAAGGTGSSEIDKPTSFIIDSSGNYIIGGSSANTTAGVEATVWRYTNAGVLDTNFAAVGYFSFGATGAAGGTTDNPKALLSDSTGNYILVGSSLNTSGGQELAIWRFTNAGALDTTFGTGTGAVVFGATGAAGATAGAEIDSGIGFQIDSSGNYVIAGTSLNVGLGQELVLWRYTNAGALDTTFNSTGYVISGTTGVAGAIGGSEKETVSTLLIDSSARYVIAGSSANTLNGNEMVYWRYSNTGTLDTSLGGTGSILFGTTGAAGATGASETDLATSIQVDSKSRFVLAGTSKNTVGGKESAMWRYLSSGVLEK